MKRSIVRIGRKGKGRGRGDGRGAAVGGEVQGLDSRVELIRALIPLGLEVVNDASARSHRVGRRTVSTRRRRTGLPHTVDLHANGVDAYLRAGRGKTPRFKDCKARSPA